MAIMSDYSGSTRIDDRVMLCVTKEEGMNNNSPAVNAAVPINFPAVVNGTADLTGKTADRRDGRNTDAKYGDGNNGVLRKRTDGRGQ